MTSITDEFNRIRTMLSGLTLSFAVMIMDTDRIECIEQSASQDATLAALARELRAKLRAIKQPDDHVQMAQAYEAYAEASFAAKMKSKKVPLERTPGTGRHGEKRPDFEHSHSSGKIHFEVKALEIEDPLRRHPQIALEALEVSAELQQRAQKTGVHVGKPLFVSGHIQGADTVSRIETTIEKINNNIKLDQIYYGPTVLVVDLARLAGSPQGASGLLPVFYHDGPPAESCVSGELWQIALGMPGEQIFSLPEFDGKSNLAGHQSTAGILREYPGLLGITFMLHSWSKEPPLFTVWNTAFDTSLLQSSCTLSEDEVEDLLATYSDGLNDDHNELGWRHRRSGK